MASPLMNSLDCVSVSTGSRLHFGPLSWRTGAWDFGGVGLTIDEPRTVVKARWKTDSEAIDSLPQRFSYLNDKFSEVSFDVEQVAPSHVGLGSGTQLAAAAALGALRLTGQPIRNVEQLAKVARRGKRSAIGLHGILQGGLLLDRGRRSSELIGELESRVEFPTEWVVLLVRPTEEEGLSGDSEAMAFEELAPMPERTTGRLYGLAHNLFQATQNKDFQVFASQLTEYGLIVGDFFREAQGGRFAMPGWELIVERLQGRAAIAQSSWGPTVAVIVERRCEEEIRAELEKDLRGFSIQSVAARNQPADVHVLSVR